MTLMNDFILELVSVAGLNDFMPQSEVFFNDITHMFTFRLLWNKCAGCLEL